MPAEDFVCLEKCLESAWLVIGERKPRKLWLEPIRTCLLADPGDPPSRHSVP
jgi:hypothetical protein